MLVGAGRIPFVRVVVGGRMPVIVIAAVLHSVVMHVIQRQHTAAEPGDHAERQQP